MTNWQLLARQFDELVTLVAIQIDELATLVAIQFNTLATLVVTHRDELATLATQLPNRHFNSNCEYYNKTPKLRRDYNHLENQNKIISQ